MARTLQIFLLALVVHVCVAETSKEKKHVNILKPKPHAPHTYSSLGSPTNISGTLLYHNLPWGQFTNVIPIFWGPNQPHQSNIIRMYQDLAPSRFLIWNNQYYGSSGYTTNTGTVGTSISFPTYSIGTCPGGKHHSTCAGLSQTVIKDQVLAWFTSTPPTINVTKNTYYPIHFDPGSNFGSNQFGFAWCAYHDFVNFTLNGIPYTVPFAVIPDNQAISTCGSGFNGGISVYLAHEWQEVTTDPYWDLTEVYGGWWDAQGYEDADKCAWDLCDGTSSSTPSCIPPGAAMNYTIQQIWTNSVGCLCPDCSAAT